jgi:nickel/cobalt transporter (NicO) family protein
MRRGLMLLGLVLGLGLMALWAAGGLQDFGRAMASAQREAQNALAGALRALRAGEAGALAALMGLAFAYGVFHAAGPGHGKVLIGGYGVARRVGLARLATLALVSSLAQATTAVVMVYAGVLVFDWTRERMVGMAEGGMVTAGHAVAAGIGLWLAARGALGLWRAGRTKAIDAPLAHGASHDHHDHAHHHEGHHHHDDTCGCGHSHGPSPAEIARATTLRETLVLIAGVAIRPCTGALFLLVLTWSMGIGAAGIAGAYAMGLGTALVTAGVAALAVWAREGALTPLTGGAMARAVPFLELAGGLAIAALSIGLLRAGP